MFSKQQLPYQTMRLYLRPEKHKNSYLCTTNGRVVPSRLDDARMRGRYVYQAGHLTRRIQLTEPCKRSKEAASRRAFALQRGRRLKKQHVHGTMNMSCPPPSLLLFSRNPLLETRESRAGMQLAASAPRLKAARPAAAAARPPGANSQKKTNNRQGIRVELL